MGRKTIKLNTNKPPETRVCRYCHIEKPLHKFRKGKTSKYGYTHMCCDCNAEQMKEKRAANPKGPKLSTEKERAKGAERTRLCRARKKAGIEVTNGRDEYTQDEINKAKAKQKERSFDYYQTEHGKEISKNYHQSEKGKEVQRKHRQSEKGKASNKRYREKYPEKTRAKATLNNAITAGKIIRPIICDIADENCSGRIEAHHKNYSKPLDVQWLCVYHHNLLHQQKQKNEEAKIKSE